MGLRVCASQRLLVSMLIQPQVPKLSNGVCCPHGPTTSAFILSATGRPCAARDSQLPDPAGKGLERWCVGSHTAARRPLLVKQVTTKKVPFNWDVNYWTRPNGLEQQVCPCLIPVNVCVCAYPRTDIYVAFTYRGISWVKVSSL